MVILDSHQAIKFTLASLDFGLFRTSRRFSN